jgi:hypothetical protein
MTTTTVPLTIAIPLRPLEITHANIPPLFALLATLALPIVLAFLDKVVWRHSFLAPKTTPTLPTSATSRNVTQLLDALLTGEFALMRILTASTRSATT